MEALDTEQAGLRKFAGAASAAHDAVLKAVVVVEAHMKARLAAAIVFFPSVAR